MKANILTFLQENLQRLFTKSPMFFKIWTLIAGVFVLITGIPELLNALPFDLHIPDVWNERTTIAVKWASRAAAAMALLTTKGIPVGITPGGNVLKVTNETKLPFTAALEKKSAEKNIISEMEVKVKPLNIIT